MKTMLFLVIAALQLPVAALAADTAAPVATVAAFHAALSRADRTAVLALLADDVLIFEEGGAELSRAEYAAHHLAADAVHAAATRQTVTRRIARAEGGTAWIATQGRTTGLHKGKPCDRLTVETMVLRNGADGWRIQHIHWSSRAPAKARQGRLP